MRPEKPIIVTVERWQQGIIVTQVFDFETPLEAENELFPMVRGVKAALDDTFPGQYRWDFVEGVWYGSNT